MQFPAESVAITKLAMIGLGVGVSGGADVLEITLCDRRLVRREGSGSPAGFATAEENDCEESRENG